MADFNEYTLFVAVTVKADSRAEAVAHMTTEMNRWFHKHGRERPRLGWPNGSLLIWSMLNPARISAQCRTCAAPLGTEHKPRCETRNQRTNRDFTLSTRFVILQDTTPV